MKAQLKTCMILVGALFIAGTPSAGERSSDDFSIVADALDSGGGRSTSSNVVNDGSFGGWGGISTVSSPVKVAKHGFVGQLYDVIGLTVSVETANLEEGAAQALAVEVTLDDDTALPDPMRGVSWLVLSGPLDVDENGLATAADVYQITAATVQGRLMGFEDTIELTVLNSDADNYGVFSGDGVDDILQVGFYSQPADIILTKLPSGELYIEFDETEWLLVSSEDLISWKQISVDEFFIPDGNGWRVAEERLLASIFLKARVK
jgi:hypothetical protein